MLDNIYYWIGAVFFWINAVGGILLSMYWVIDYYFKKKP